MRPTPSSHQLPPGAILLAAFLGLRLALHALYVPAFEGPDEPFHLDRITSLTGSRIGSTPAALLDPRIAAAVRARPCAPDLARSFGCPSFHSVGNATFNVLRTTPSPLSPSRVPNYEAHQPPLFYFSAAAFLRLLRLLQSLLSAPSDPVVDLLFVRLFNVALVILAVCGPIRHIALSLSTGSTWFVLSVLVLLLPSASESLARCANDAAVFFWSSLLVSSIQLSRRTLSLAVLLSLGPLLKLTALPIAIFAIAWLALTRPWWHGAVAAVSSLVFLPIQMLRGYLWGGTVELNAPSSCLHETPAELLTGFARSAYTLLKTAIWLGEWSFFRPPLWLIMLFAAFLLGLATSLRVRPLDRRQIPHAVAALATCLLVSFFFVAHRIHWAQWGGVGGWYVWGWFPLLAVSAPTLFRLAPASSRPLLCAFLLLVLISTCTWFLHANSVYASRDRPASLTRLQQMDSCVYRLPSDSSVLPSFISRSVFVLPSALLPLSLTRPPYPIPEASKGDVL